MAEYNSTKNTTVQLGPNNSRLTISSDGDYLILTSNGGNLFTGATGYII